MGVPFSEGDPMAEVPVLFYKLLPELAESGACEELSGALPCERLNRGSQGFELDGQIHYKVVLTNTGDGVLLTGAARAKGSSECARCLEEALFEVEGEVQGYFILNPDKQDRELSDDEFTAVDSGGIVDLAVPILAAIIYELPQVLLCREDCVGLCPVCGVNRNEQQCDCAERLSPDNPFAVLKELVESEIRES
jgi:uncharacterized protein